MKFIKAESYGNDFAVLFRPIPVTFPLSDAAKAMCRRHRGVGADGLIVIGNSEKCDFSMRIFNPDGSEAEMCGNALRIALTLYHAGDTKQKSGYTVETPGGVKSGRICENGDVVANIGLPVFDCEKIPFISPSPLIYRPFHGFFATCLSFGNPHLAVECDDAERFDVEKYGPLFEHDKSFPKGTNVHFYTVKGENDIYLRPWERVCGETLGCSTGSAAAAVAANISGKCARHVFVHQKGGVIEVTLTESGVLVGGRARKVFEGEWQDETFGTV